MAADDIQTVTPDLLTRTILKDHMYALSSSSTVLIQAARCTISESHRPKQQLGTDFWTSVKNASYLTAAPFGLQMAL